MTSIVQGNLRRIERNDTPGTETCSIRMDTLEVIQPELEIVVSGIILHEGQLRPAHRAVIPVRVSVSDARRLFTWSLCHEWKPGRTADRGRSRSCDLLQEHPPGMLH